MAKKRGNNEGSITHRSDGRWMGRYTVHTAEGPKRKTLYGKTRQEVADMLVRAFSNRAQGLRFDAGTLAVATIWIVATHATQYRRHPA